MITKIDIYITEYQPNIRMFVWDYDSLVKSNLKQIIKTNSKSTKCLRIKLKKKLKRIQSKKQKVKSNYNKLQPPPVIKKSRYNFFES
jgi:hypothetical protein